MSNINTCLPFYDCMYQHMLPEPTLYSFHTQHADSEAWFPMTQYKSKSFCIQKNCPLLAIRKNVDERWLHIKAERTLL